MNVARQMFGDVEVGRRECSIERTSINPSHIPERREPVHGAAGENVLFSTVHHMTGKAVRSTPESTFTSPGLMRVVDPTQAARLGLDSTVVSPAATWITKGSIGSSYPDRIGHTGSRAPKRITRHSVAYL